jgi:hypothetical protein
MNIKKLRMKKIVLVIAAIATMVWATGMAANAQTPFPNTPYNLMSQWRSSSGGDTMYIPNSRPQKIGGGLCIQGYLTMEDMAIQVPVYQACK